MSKLDQSKTPLFSALKDIYAGRDILPFHVPGHKRGKGVDKEFYDLLKQCSKEKQKLIYNIAKIVVGVKFI